MDLCGPLWASVDLCGPLWTSVDLCMASAQGLPWGKLETLETAYFLYHSHTKLLKAKRPKTTTQRICYGCLMQNHRNNRRTHCQVDSKYSEHTSFSTNETCNTEILQFQTPLRTSVNICGPLCTSVHLCGPLWTSVHLCGHLWTSVDLWGPLGTSADLWGTHIMATSRMTQY